MDPLSLKKVLYDYCVSYAEQRIETCRKAMEAAQEAANNEEKSSAGDKYETSRAMMQLERDKNAQQLTEALKLKQAMSQCNPAPSKGAVRMGSLVYTDQGVFYISISAGKLTVNQSDCFAIAPASPLGNAFLNSNTGDKVLFNHKSYLIQNIL